MKEVPVVKPIVVSVAEAKMQQQLEDMPSFTNSAPVAPTAPAGDEMDAIRAAVERRKQAMGVGTAPTSSMRISSPFPGLSASTPAAQVPEPPSTKICPTCGNELPGKAKFCNKCGNKFT